MRLIPPRRNNYPIVMIDIYNTSMIAACHRHSGRGNFNGAVKSSWRSVGYEVLTPLGDFETAQLEKSVKFCWPYHHVREQALQELYGFSSLAAKKLAEMLITGRVLGQRLPSDFEPQ